MNNDESNKYKNDLFEMEARLNSRRKVETILKLYTVLGALISIFALAYFVLSTLNIEITDNQLVALLSAGIGIALSMTSWAMLLFRKQREIDESKRMQAYQEVSEVIFLWSEFEEAGKNKLDNLGVDYNKHSIRQVIKLLEENNIIDTKEQIILSEAMQIRNAAAHGTAQFSKELVQRTIDSLNNIIEKVRSANK